MKAASESAILSEVATYCASKPAAHGATLALPQEYGLDEFAILARRIVNEAGSHAIR